MLRDQLRIAGLLAALVVALLLIWGWRVEAPRNTRDGETVVWHIRRGDITRVSIEGAFELVLRPDGDVVRLGGRQVPADRMAVNDLVDALEEAGRGVAVAGLSEEAAGLLNPVRVTVTTDAVHVLDVGDEAPVGDRTYVRRPGGPVVAVYGGLGKVARRSSASFQDSALLPRGELRQILVERSGQMLRSATRAQDRWQWDTPTQDAVHEWVTRLQDVRVDAWLEAPIQVSVQIVARTASGEVRVGVGGADGAWLVDFGDGRVGSVEEQLDGMW